MNPQPTENGLTSRPQADPALSDGRGKKNSTWPDVVAHSAARRPGGVQGLDLEWEMESNGKSTFEPLLDSQRAAALLGIHPKTLQKMARAGTVPSHRIGDLWRFRTSELDKWLRSGVHSKPPLVP
jgi:excisionase family DNA binding protein